MQGLPSLPGIVLLWFLPKRVGASLAASGWHAAVAAHMLSVIVGLGLIVCAELPPTFNSLVKQQFLGWDIEIDLPAPRMTCSEYVRGPFAAIAVVVHAAGPGSGGFARSLLALTGIQGAVLLLAVVMMPFAAAGEPAGRLFGRCLRLTWWSTTLLIPLGLVWWAEPQWRSWLDLPDEWHAVDSAALALFGVLWLIVLLRSGYRYAGKAQGPAWSARTPRCEKCGYRIVGLPYSTNCPECARPVAESLAERRAPPPFAVADTPVRTISAFWPTAWKVITTRDFFARLPVHSGHSRARAFFLMVCVVNWGLAFLGAWRVGTAFQAEVVLVHALADAVVVACVVLLGHVLLAAAFAGAVSAIARRALQPAAVATFYLMSSTVPITIGAVTLLVAGVTTATIVDDIATPLAVDVIMSLLLAVGLVVFAWALVRALMNARRAIVQTRFANR
ncbi:MAG: hypothetical protein JSV19_06060 [Phycisphaerales bacterium]|nr:MAG: hypothetical protein JSV19_06060 [Phycisphaerales bacterium]